MENCWEMENWERGLHANTHCERNKLAAAGLEDMLGKLHWHSQRQKGSVADKMDCIDWGMGNWVEEIPWVHPDGPVCNEDPLEY